MTGDKHKPARVEGELPRNLAVIMDGNGRWAQGKGMRRILGHREGIGSVREITTECAKLGLESLTLYAFSVENWKRPRVEVRFLMGLLEDFLVTERPTLMENNVRLEAIGRLDTLPDGARRRLEETRELTSTNTGMLLRLALSYGGRSEVADGLKRFAEDVRADKVSTGDIDEETFRKYLYDAQTPDPDLLIRTAGEMRLSNFLLWQVSYSELYVTEACWPEFRKAHLMEAFEAYGKRTRKYGGLIQDHDSPISKPGESA